jgi:hypothetical protein
MNAQNTGKQIIRPSDIRANFSIPGVLLEHDGQTPAVPISHPDSGKSFTAKLDSNGLSIENEGFIVGIDARALLNFAERAARATEGNTKW